MDTRSLMAADDFRHTLQEGEHEAFYFPFSAPDGQVFGFLRALFGHDAVLELIALRVADRTWVYEQRTALPGKIPLSADASGPALTLTCREPWRSWRCHFHSTVRAVRGEAEQRAELDLTFAATNDPELYRFGPYQQAQQDGRLTGQLQVGGETWTGELLCYRDHSWGQRPMGAAAGWTIASAPDHFYVVVAKVRGQAVSWGRFTTPGGAFVSVRAPQITAVGEGWRIEDPEAGLAAWRAHRLAPPIVTHLGPPGQEAVRDAPRPGDLYRDEIGPALFISPQGERVVGFVEQARRLP